MNKLQDRLSQALPVMPKPIPQPSPPRRILRPKSYVRDVTLWLVRQINTGNVAWGTRIKRLLTWAVYLVPRMQTFLAAVIGPRIEEAAVNARNEICETCPQLQKRLARKAPFIHRYCGACGCPKWPLAELGWKNTLEKWYCLQGLHEKPSEPTAWTVIREEEEAWIAETTDAMSSNGGNGYGR